MPPSSGPSLGQLSRRELLAGMAAGGVGLALSSRAGRLIEKAAATPGRCGSLDDVEHVVILIMENRSFDHYFGTYRGVAGFSDPRVLHQRQRSGQPIWYQFGWGPGDAAPQAAHYLNPFRLDTTDLRTGAECTNDISHSWVSQHLSWDDGAMDSWVRTHVAADGIADGPTTMGFYTREDLGSYYALADAFTLCDAYHCSVMGSTVPNRLYSMSATIDPDGDLGGGPVISNPASGSQLVPGQSTATFHWQTMPEALEAAGVSWKAYQVPGSQATDALTDTVLYYFPAFRDPSSPMFERGMVPAFPGDFQTDVAAGTLPQVSWLVPSGPLDEHPPAPPSLGQLAATRQALETLMSNPAIWEKTVLFVSWDENGGFFDHVPPPVAPRGTAGEWLTTKPVIGDEDASGGSTIAGPIGLGFRVPMLVLSPLAVGGLVCSDTFDHTSTLRFIETRFGVPVPNLAPWRRANTGDLTSALNFAAGARRTPTTFDQVLASGLGAASDGARAAIQCTEAEAQSAHPKPYPVPTPQSLPSQEPGRARRPSGQVC